MNGEWPRHEVGPVGSLRQEAPLWPIKRSAPGFGLRSALYALRATLYILLLAGCSALPAALGGPTPVPTAPIDPFNATVATAEAEGDTVARASAFYERGNFQLDQGDAAAIADYDQAIALDPSNARAFNNRGLAHLALGQPDAALADYAEAIRIDPTYLRAYTNRIVLLEQRGDLAALAETYGALAEADPERAADHRYREGVALAGLQDRAGARQAFDEALRRDPQHVDARYERGLLHFAEGRPAEAIDDFDAALQLSPRAANAYYARGLAHNAVGDPQQARADFTTVLTLTPDDPAALIGRAVVAQALGDAAAAREDLERALTLPLDDTLRQTAELLQAQLDAAGQTP